MKYGGILAALVILCGSSSYYAYAQQAHNSQANVTGKNETRPIAGQPAKNESRVVRDPVTGRVFRQQLVSVSVPVTTWENQPVTQTVYEPKLVASNVPTQQTYYVAQTNYVLQARVRGRWNPFRPTVQTYEYRPVTTWTPVVRSVNQPVVTQQWIPKQQTVYVPTPVQKTELQQQLVHTEIPQPVTTAVAARPPFVRVPLLARQRILPWQPRSTSMLASTTSAALRPIQNSPVVANVQAANYSAPLRTASNGGFQVRDALQTGMSATVLR